MTTSVEKDTQKLYDNQAQDWSRKEPILLSDYSARPYVLSMCEPIDGLDILDLGCGEGYVSRELKKRGATNIFGIDISEEMINRAIAEQVRQNLDGMTFKNLDVRQFDESNAKQYDLVLAMFLFNYLDVPDTQATMKKIFNWLKPGGYFVFAVPHPLLAYLKSEDYPFYFRSSGGYFSARNELFPGEIWRRDGVAVNVQCVHKTIEDYFTCLRAAGFELIPEVRELHITEEHIKMDPGFFEPLRELPLHVAFKVKKP
ncbi:class I SAM-dependent methyltransferase [Aliikangiella maris]|uniref:Class I SAM-dependent methyltransferase n=2 Tax=Aliikangiella maris TaxID=3162458 RepID=A0ABV3MR08_9GAMM